MRKNKRILSIIILAVLILLMFLAGYTFARYYKNINAGKATAKVARWSFGAGNTNSEISLAEGPIAPGDNGNFLIEVDSTNSEVPLEYEVKFSNVRNIPRNMKFAATTKDINGEEWTTSEVSSLAELAEELKGEIRDTKNNPKRSITVNWNWDFNANDTSLIDTEDGTLLLDENGNVVYDESNLTSLDVGFDVEIVGRQIQKQI